MTDDFESITTKLLSNGFKDILADGKVGIEKESLRVTKSKISRKKHQSSLGSALCHKHITTDFSEALLEFITPPFVDKNAGLSFLDNIHHFVSHNIGDEIIWPFSMPPFIESDDQIPIASYGSSNLALFKTTYRNGLSHRYGRAMQAIAGIHFNYSLSEKIWSSEFFNNKQKNSSTQRSTIYFRMLRNLHRMNWLILFLFGASPIVSKNFLSNRNTGFQKLDKHSYYLPYATSLRMSDLGYQNIHQSNNLAVSFNSLQEYTFDLKHATETRCEDYQKIFELVEIDHPQINSNILQIEDEYYSIARPKSSVESNQRLIAKLNDTGVDYIELRSLDLNPFEKTGIDLETVYFLELFLIYCMLKSSPPINEDEIVQIRQNDFLVATKGRDTSLNLNNNQGEISLKDWANQILDEMMAIAEILDYKSAIFKNIIQKTTSKIMDPDQTLSGILLNKILTEKMSFHELGRNIGEDHKNQYLNMERAKNPDWLLLEKESAASVKRQAKLEEKSDQSFEDFVTGYFNDPS